MIMLLETPLDGFTPESSAVGNLPVENCFSKIVYNKKSPIRSRLLQEFSKKCATVIDKVDYMTLISPSEEIQRLPCFIIPNDTNSSERLFDLYSGSDGTGEEVARQPVAVHLDANDPSHVGFTDISHFFGDFTLQKVVQTQVLKKYILSVIFDGSTIPLFVFTFYNPNSREAKINGFSSKIEIKGKAFQLQFITSRTFNIKDLLFVFLSQGYGGNLNDIRSILEMFYITRLDYCFDFFAPRGSKGLKPNDIFTRKRKHKATYYDDSHQLSSDKYDFGVKNIDGSFYTGWSYGNRGDNYIYSRFYHKQIDIDSNGSNNLYYEWLKYKGEVRRLEFEFGSRFCNNKDGLGKVYFYDEFDDNKLSNHVYSYMGLASKSNCYSPRYLQMDIPFDDLPRSRQIRQVNMFKNLSYRLAEAGIDVVSLAYNNISEAQKIRIKNGYRDRKDDIFRLLKT